MREYRLVTNGETFRIQGRVRHKCLWFSWWDTWVDLGGYEPFLVFVVKDYATREEAVSAIRKAREREEVRRRPWYQVTNSEEAHDRH